jgi:hypothetical protein
MAASQTTTQGLHTQPAPVAGPVAVRALDRVERAVPVVAVARSAADSPLPDRMVVESPVALAPVVRAAVPARALQLVAARQDSRLRVCLVRVRVRVRLVVAKVRPVAVRSPAKVDPASARVWSAPKQRAWTISLSA